MRTTMAFATGDVRSLMASSMSRLFARFAASFAAIGGADAAGVLACPFVGCPFAMLDSSPSGNAAAELARDRDPGMRVRRILSFLRDRLVSLRIAVTCSQIRLEFTFSSVGSI
eukprot:5740063-Pleurochrysis_carterae.AAC.1